MQIVHPPASGLPGIALRQLKRKDAEAWYAYLQLHEVTAHTSWNLGSVDDLAPIFDSLESDSPDSQIRLAIVDEDQAKLLGTIGFHSISAANKTAEIAYDLAPTHWGRGIASAVCKTVSEWSFQNLGFNRIQASVLPSNLASTKVLQASGYQYEGLLRAYRLVRGEPRDYQIFSRLAH